LGGLQSSASFWLMLPPLMAIFYGGLLEGLFWSLICLIIIAVFFCIEYLHIPMPSSPISNPNLLQTFSLGGLILVILWLVYFFETGKRDASQEVLSINSQLRQAKDEAEESAQRAEIANRLKTEFLANMSHELRTPLNGIIGFTELICSGKAGAVTPEQQEFLQDVLSSAHHLLQLINDILDLTKIESGKMVFHAEPINLRLLCDQVKDSLVTLIKRKHIEFVCEIDPALRHIVIDPRKLKQVIYNYLSNAIKLTPESGRIELHIYPFGIDFFKLEVRDNGIGIQEVDLRKLFVEFQQLDSSFSKKYQGTGLGLALTQHIVEAQGGYVGVESKFGKGSTFFAILPCLPRNTA
jgi:signal transduction histidine kinase